MRSMLWLFFLCNVCNSALSVYISNTIGRPVNMSVGTNMFINGKLGNYFFYTLSVLN